MDSCVIGLFWVTLWDYIKNINPLNDGKRKRIEVYNVDEGVSESATKLCGSSVGERRCEGVKKLLIPKQEK